MLCLLMNQGKTTQIRCSNLGHLPQIWANLLFFLSFSNRNYFLKKTFLQDPFYEKFSHAETHDSAKKPCRSTHSFSSSSNPEMVPKLPKIGTFCRTHCTKVRTYRYYYMCSTFVATRLFITVALFYNQ